MTPNSTSEPELEVQPEKKTAPEESVEAADAATTPVEAAPVEAAETPAEEAKVEPAEVETGEAEPAEAEAAEAESAEAGETVAAPVDAETSPDAEKPVATEAPATTKIPVATTEAPAEATEAPAGATEVPPATTEVPVEAPPATVFAPASQEVLATSYDGDDLEDDLEDEEAAALATTPGGRYPTLVPLVSALAGLVALVSILIVAFALPAVHSSPTKLPIGLAGTPAITGQLKPLFITKASPFKVTVYPNEADLRSAIKHRKVYGGLSVNTTAATMLVSSAASPVAAETLGSVASELGTQFNTQIAINDVVPAPKKDPRGIGLASLGLPLVIGSILPALLLGLLYRRRAPAQLGTAAGAAVLIGGALAAILTFWLGATDGANFWLLTLAIAAGVLATSLILLGLNATAGRIGLGIGIAVLVLIAAPLSGLSSAKEWLPHPWGDLGQLLPPGASATLLRSTAFFDGHGAGQSLIVLAVWALVGLALLVLGTLLQQQRHIAVEGDPAV
jgi:hypothetical protein